MLSKQHLIAFKLSERVTRMRRLDVQDFTTAPALVTVDSPIPGNGEVLLDILACGLNFADLLMAKGLYQDTPKPPFSLGMEVCGVVRACGSGARTFKPGDRVLAFAGSGGLADQMVIAQDRCRGVPESMSDSVAAGFQVAYGTSHLGLTRRARLQPGETLLVLGAAGGVGLTAVEIGKAMGAGVIAVARGTAKLEVARAAGADHTIEASEDLTEALRALGGVDVIYDPIGGDATVAAMRALRPEGRLLVIGFASGDVPTLKANHMLVKNVDVLGFYWGGYLKFRPEALLDSLDELMQWHSEGRLTPHISHVLPLDRAVEGLELLRSRASTGKIVITP